MPEFGEFNANNVEPDKGFELMPVGDYVMQVVEGEVKPTADYTGTRIVLTCEIMDGEYKGRKVWHGLNWLNKSEKAMEISRAQLSALCHAVGKMEVSSTEELVGLPFLGTLKIRNGRTLPDGRVFDATNEIAKFSALTQQPQQPQAQQSQQPAQPAQQQPQQPAQQPQQQPPQQQQPSTQAPPWGQK